VLIGTGGAADRMGLVRAEVAVEADCSPIMN